MQPDLLRLRRRLWNQMSVTMRDLVGLPTAELRRYERRYRQELARPGAPAGLDEVLAQAQESDVVFCADYHTYRPAQLTCLRLLEALATRTPRVALLLELALSHHQHHLDRYLRGQIGEADLLRRLDYGRTWGFSWSGYRPLFEYARSNAIPLIGINGPGDALRSSLEQRDAWAADVVVRTALHNPGTRLLVLAGDLHVASAHLPAWTARQAARAGLELNLLQIFQNSEDLYWSLARAGLELEALRLGERAYCLFSGTPWAKLESYVCWLEGIEGTGGAEPAAHTLDYGDRIFELAALLARFLGLPPAGIDGFTVYTGDDPLFHDQLGRLPRTSELLSHALASNVFVVPGASTLRVSRLDLAHAAEAAGELVHEVAAPVPMRDFRSSESAFFRRAHRRALAAFAAQLLNPIRSTASDVHDPRAAGLVESYRRAVERCLEAKATTPVPKAVFADDLRLGLAVSRAVGRTAGDRLYRRFIAGRVRPADLAVLFREPPAEDQARLSFAHLLVGAAHGCEASVA